LDGLPNGAAVEVLDDLAVDLASQPGARHFRVHLAGDRAEVGVGDLGNVRSRLVALEMEGARGAYQFTRLA
jgi:hypothetical protein